MLPALNTGTTRASPQDRSHLKKAWETRERRGTTWEAVRAGRSWCIVLNMPRGAVSTCDRKLGREGGGWSYTGERFGEVVERGGEGVAALLRFNVAGIARVTGRWRG